jgi:hypothetical protein
MTYKVRYRCVPYGPFVHTEFSNYELAETFLIEKLVSLGILNVANFSDRSPKNVVWFGLINPECQDVADIYGVIQAV